MMTAEDDRKQETPGASPGALPSCVAVGLRQLTPPPAARAIFAPIDSQLPNIDQALELTQINEHKDTIEQPDFTSSSWIGKSRIEKTSPQQ